MTLNRWTKILVSTSVALFLGACAHDVKPADIPATANPVAEVDSLGASLDTARTQQVDVLAPENFKKAEKSFKEAQERRSKGKKGEKILESVGYGRAYLQRAEVAAQRSRTQLADVLKARDLAVVNGANNLHDDRVKLDKKLKNYTERIEENKNIDRDDLADLQQDYLDLELRSIKATKLSEAKNTLDNAEKKGAKRLVPQAYREAKEKIETAEKSIETDRHDQTVVNQASGAALSSAQRALALVETARENKKRSPEQIASEIENRDVQLDQAGAMNAAAQAQMTAKEQQLAQERAAAGTAATTAAETQRKLDEQNRFNQAFEQARSDFKPEEADVYRQGDNMIIRLKAMKFSPGRSDLPSSSMSALNKAKKIIGELKPEDIVVEGHTDSTGAPELNKRLSSERAEAVANYFVSENIVDSQKVEAVGYGYEKPIASNKNKSGRELNRRVDIIIKPSTASAQKTEEPQSKETTTPQTPDSSVQ
jgi:OmpA-OmpF porin, OOP family